MTGWNVVNFRAAIATGLACMAMCVTGCTSVLTPITGIPVTQVPEELLGVRRSQFTPVPIVALARSRDEEYTLGAGDILAVYIPGVLPFSPPNSVPAAPPVNFGDSDLPPSIGFPIPVQEKGMVSLPLLPPFSVAGLSVGEARERITEKYRKQEILRRDDEQAIVSLMKGRANNILVFRSNVSGGDSGIGVSSRSDASAQAFSVTLPFQKSDVLNALSQSGGLPGVNEKNEVVVFRTSRIPADQRSEIIAGLMGGHGDCSNCSPITLEADLGLSSSGCFAHTDGLLEDQLVTRIPLRLPPNQQLVISPSDVELEDGDIVLVESRETEFFYTGGLLGGGQFLLPRDYDLDILGALAIAGNGLGSQGGGGGGGGGVLGFTGGLGGPSPSLLFVIRKLPCGRTFNIMVDIQQAMNQSSQNIIVQPGDTLILRYKPHEELTNFGIGTFFTFGIRELLRD
ncbi:MAG: polysaccharide biosynthesis/export family protein [Planctomycetota bacterium]